MARTKRQLKAKEPIALRQKPLSKGGYSLYLDIYQNGKRRYDFLKLYLVPEIDDATKRQNQRTLQAANTIKAQRVIELANEKAGISRVSTRSKILLKDYIAIYRQNSEKTHKGGSYCNNIDSMSNRLFEYVGDNIDRLQMKDIDVNFCRGFVSFLSNATMSNCKPLSKVTAFHYFSTFKNALQDAVIDEVIASNPVDKMKKSEKPKRPEVLKPYLDATEIKDLIEANCRIDGVKRAFLFSCFTGLRISDVQALKWENIWKDGDNWRVGCTMVKTQEYIESKLSKEALACLPEKGDKKSNDVVFELPSIAVLEKELKKWAKEAGITKTVTFHTARHSFATMALTAGASLYTISKMLGHKSVTTTTIYAKIVDKARDEAVDGVSSLFK